MNNNNNTIIFPVRFKDGKPYPWPNDVSSLILYPEAENQTIYTRSASFADVGNYTCTLRNDTHKSEHHVALNVQGKKHIHIDSIDHLNIKHLTFHR